MSELALLTRLEHFAHWLISGILSEEPDLLKPATTVTSAPISKDSRNLPQDMQNDFETSVSSPGPVSHVSGEQRNYSLRMALAAVKAAAENRGQNIIVIDLTQQTSMFDFFVIVTGSSRRQLHAVASEIDRVLRKEMSEARLSEAGYDESRWIVQDFGSVVIHLFDEETRAFYDLESLWGDGTVIDVSEIVANATAQMTRLSQ